MSSLILPSDYAGGMVKYCTWGPFAEDGWPYVHRLVTDGRGSHSKFAAWTKKFASKETGEMVQKFVADHQPKKGEEYFLSTSLGAFEAWGSNNNGDGFYEEDLVKESDDVGYRSFMKHARAYEHHKNKDPEKAIGRIVLASYNPKMRRVELIKALDREKAASWIDQWHKTGSQSTSMGTKVAYDVCSECGNRARSPKEYCDHAKHCLKKVAMNGHRIHVRNPDPRFFDDSCVTVPADKTAGVMEKIACGAYADFDRSKEGHMLSAIEGEARFPDVVYVKTAEDTGAEAAVEAGVTPEQILAHDSVVDVIKEQVLSAEDERVLKLAAESDPELPKELLVKMAMYPLEMSISSMHNLGIVPQPREFQFLALHSMKMEKLAEQLYEKDLTFEAVETEETPDSYEKTAYVADWNISPTLVGELTPFVPARSYIPGFLEPRIEKVAMVHAQGYMGSGNEYWHQVVVGEEFAKQAPFLKGYRKDNRGFHSESGTIRMIRRVSDPKEIKAAKREVSKYAAEVVPAERIRQTDPGIARIMLALGLSYGIVRAIMGKDPKLVTGLARTTHLHPAVAAALLTAGTAAGVKLISSSLTPASIATRDPGESYEKVSHFIDSLEKTAGPKDYTDWIAKTPSAVKHVVVPFSAGYLSSAYLRGKQMRGQPTSSGQNMVADHPLAAGVAAVAGTALARKGLQKLVAAVKP